METTEELRSWILGRTSAIPGKPDKGITLAEALKLLALTGPELVELLSIANTVRDRCMGNSVSLCSIVNAKSGNCPEDCTFCAQSAHYNTSIEYYPMKNAEEILAAAKESAKNGAEHFGIVTSGHHLSDRDFGTVVTAVRSITSETGLQVCASLGVLTLHQLEQLKSAGLTKYHHNLETSESYFDQICTTHSFQERVDMVKRVKAAGLQVCSGGIIGLGERPSQRLELANTLQELDVDSIPINILVPIHGTALDTQRPLPPLEILKTIALFRLMLPSKVIKLAGGREANLGDLQALTLTSGANGLMLGNYLTTPGRSVEKDLKMIRDLGLRPGSNNEPTASSRSTRDE